MVDFSIVNAQVSLPAANGIGCSSWDGFAISDNGLKDDDGQSDGLSDRKDEVFLQLLVHCACKRCVVFTYCTSSESCSRGRTVTRDGHRNT